MNDYSDIINTPYPFELRHPRMSLENRAPQFAPFAALTGFDEMVEETARTTRSKIELTEEEKLALGEKLQSITEMSGAKMSAGRTSEDRMVNITYFEPDEIKTGGRYVTVTGIIKKTDPILGKIILKDGKSIAMDDISDICPVSE